MKTKLLFLCLVIFAFGQLRATDLATLRPKGTGNATVPVDAVIQPPQAFVAAAIANWAHFGLARSRFWAPDCGITSIDLSAIEANSGNGYSNVNLSGNALPVEQINAILAYLVTAQSDPEEIDLSGGTNAAPTGQGLTDKAALISNGWTVTTN